MSIHNLLRRRSTTLEDVECFIRSFPKSLRAADRKTGQLPLHTAVQRHVVPFEIVKFLVESDPAAVMIPDHQGHLPMHAAVAGVNHVVLVNNCKKEIVSLLYEHFPLATRAVDKRGFIPLHLAIAGGFQDVLEFLLAKDPGSVKIRGMQTKNLPIHMVFHSKKFDALQNENCIHKRILSLHPEASQVQDSNGDLPLHLAVKSKLQGPDPNADSLMTLVKALIWFHPEAIRTKNKKGQLPLHCAVIEACRDDNQDTNYEKIKLLIQIHPGGLKKRDNDGRLPLHLACIHSHQTQHCDLVRLLLSIAPDVVGSKDIDGNTPLHLSAISIARSSILNEYSFRQNDILELLIKMHPEGLRTGNHEGNLPIHSCLICNEETSRSNPKAMTQVASRLLSAYPEGSSALNKQGDNALHVVLGNTFGRLQPSCTMHDVIVAIDMIVQNNRKALAEENSDGHIPLQVAIETGCYEVVKYLLEECPDAICHQDRLGMLPIHTAASFAINSNRHCDIRIIQLLIDLFPSSLAVPDNLGRTPLHVALDFEDQIPDLYSVFARSNSVKATQILLLESFPSGLAIPDKAGRLPLHIACQHFGQLDEDLLNRTYLTETGEPLCLDGKSALLHTDKNGCLPIHYLCKNHIDAPNKLLVAQRFIENYPATAVARSHDGALPLLYACESNAALDIVYFLLSHSMELFG